MDFDFSEEQELLRASTRRFLATEHSLADVRSHLEDGALFDSELWEEGAELGWTAMLVPPTHRGGSVTGQPLVDLVVLAEELGRTLHPGPLIPCNVVADAIATFGTAWQRAGYMEGIATGVVLAGWCVSAEEAPEPASVGVQAEAQADGVVLRGRARWVHGGADAGVLLVVARQGDHFINVLVPPWSKGLSTRVMRGLDVTRRFGEVQFDGVVVSPDAIVPGGWEVAERGLALATVLQAAESVGGADAIFGATVDYLKQRVQFGRAIGSFQAIKHRVADLLMELEAMRAATHYAALAWGDQLPDAAEAVATAGSYVSDAFAHLCGEALQLHGGIGFTWESDIHLFVRRAKVNQVLYGDGAWHRERLVQLIANGRTH